MTEIELTEQAITILKMRIDRYEEIVTRLTASLRERRAYLANLQGVKRDA
jgi:hypothetical protein